MDNLEDQVFATIRQTLRKPNLALDLNTLTKEIAGWDSLSHVRILVALEKKLKFHFTTTEVVALQSHLHRVDDLLQFVRGHLK